MHGRPASQGKILMQEKEAWARRLLAQGLTITQISMQPTCSRNFVRRIAKEQQTSSEQTLQGTHSSDQE